MSLILDLVKLVLFQVAKKLQSILCVNDDLIVLDPVDDFSDLSDSLPVVSIDSFRL